MCPSCKNILAPYLAYLLALYLANMLGIIAGILPTSHSGTLSGIVAGLAVYVINLLAFYLAYTVRWRAAIQRLLWRSTSAHCDLELAVEVPTGIWRLLFLESNNPHLTGAEQLQTEQSRSGVHMSCMSRS